MKSAKRLTDTDAYQGVIRTPQSKPRVEKGVPIPPSPLVKDRCPIEDLEPGDSFLIPEGVTRGGVYDVAKRLGIVIEIHHTVEGERCWRVK